MKLRSDEQELLLELVQELLPDFLQDVYFGMSLPELFVWLVLFLISIIGRKA